LKACGYVLTDDDIIIHIISNLTKDYDAICDQLENELGHEDLKKKVTIVEVKNRLRNKFNKLKMKVKSFGESIEDSNEKLMAIKSHKKVFKGKCHNCGKFGHRISECTEKKKGEESPAPDKNGDRQDKFCTFCKKKGHTENYCFQKKKLERMQNNKNNTNETVNAISVSNFSQIRPGTEKAEKLMMVKHKSNKIISEKEYKFMFIADSGASAHFVKSLDGVRNVEKYNQPLDLPNGTGKLAVTHIGYFHGTSIHKDGTNTQVKLRVMYVPGITENIISINEALKNGWSLSNDKDVICLSCGNSTMRFDTKDECGNGHVMCCKIIPNIIKNEKLNNIVSINKKNININDLHVILGHPSEDKTRLTAKEMGLEVFGEFKICEDCHMGKARRKKLSKIPKAKTGVPFENLNIDIEPIKNTTNGVNKNWIMVTDRCSDMKWSFFVKRKNEQVKIIYEWFLEMRDKNYHCKTLRLDNSGENKKLQHKLKTSGFGHIVYEYTSPRTPKQNGKVERGFATVLGRARSMMNSAGLTSNMRSRLWPEYARTATLLENAMPTRAHGTPIVRFSGGPYKWFKINNMRKFGECAVITTKTDTTPKLNNRGIVAMFLGYSEQHSADTLRFMNIKTHRVIYSRDYMWLNKNWGQYHNITDVEIYYENKDDELAEDWDNVSKSTEDSQTNKFFFNQELSESDSSSSSDDDFNDYNLISDSENESVGNKEIDCNSPITLTHDTDHILFSPSSHKSKGGNNDDRYNTDYKSTRSKINTGKHKLAVNPVKLFQKKASVPSTKLSRAQKKMASDKTFLNVANKNPTINYIRIGKGKKIPTHYDHLRNEVLLSTKLSTMGK
jgi:hypothetical protein